jgi:hypothetical protein
MKQKLILARNAAALFIEMDISMNDLTRMAYLEPDSLVITEKQGDKKTTRFQIKNHPTTALGRRTATFPFTKEKSKVKILFPLEGNEPKFHAANAAKWLKELEKNIQNRLEQVNKTEEEMEEL